MSLVNEMYFAITLDRPTCGLIIIACRKGGTSIEDLAEKFPDMIIKVPIDVFIGITDEDAAKVVDGLAPKVADKKASMEQVTKLYELFSTCDCTEEFDTSNELQSTGIYIAVSRYASATPLPPSILSRGIGWQGVGILLSGLFGTVTGSTVSAENAGLLALTRVGSRRVVQISAGFMIFFSILGKFGAVFASIPAPIIAALYCLFFAYVGSAGLSFLQFCNLNSFRTKFIVGFSIFMGLSVPQYFNEYTVVKGYGPVHTKARWFNDMINVPFQSEAFVAGFLALFLDLTLHRNDTATRRDRGVQWWDKFRSFRSDTRSEEFYSLPFNLNKFFPSV